LVSTKVATQSNEPLVGALLLLLFALLWIENHHTSHKFLKCRVEGWNVFGWESQQPMCQGVVELAQHGNINNQAPFILLRQLIDHGSVRAALHISNVTTVVVVASNAVNKRIKHRAKWVQVGRRTSWSRKSLNACFASTSTSTARKALAAIVAVDYSRSTRM
jgi:hypothetical protein